MNRRITISPKASRDLEEQFDYIAQENLEAAMRFFDSVRQTFSQLAQTPGVGTPCQLSNPRLQGLRQWAVKGFKKHLIYYLTDDSSVEIVRLLHSARDILPILEQEE